MKKAILLIVLLPLVISGQVRENFSDGNFTADPSWNGDLENFKLSSSTAVPEGQRPALQLDAVNAGQSYLSVAYAMTGNLEWQFWLKLSFNTSAGNFARIYLLTDNDTLKNPLKGYFLQIGGPDDSVYFCRQDSSLLTSLVCMKHLYTGNPTNALRMRIVRRENDSWSFWGDASGGYAMTKVGEISDSAYQAGDHCGIFFQYTSSNASRFYFDDFYAGPEIIDTTPPSVVSVIVENPSEIALKFNEPIELMSAEEETNYQLLPDSVQPYSAIRLLEPSEVRLFFDAALENSRTYYLQIKDVKDLSGNVTEQASIQINYYLPQPYDIIFTEIMADPTPSAGLPEQEYLEIFNRSQQDIRLKEWTLKIGSTVHDLPDLSIPPGEYFILCAEGAVGTMQAYGRAIGLNSFVLPNSGTAIHLTDRNGLGICYLDYDATWYGDEIKSDGGYSLEICHLDNPCLDKTIWSASGNPEGGTPGGPNFNTIVIEEGLRIAGICCVSPDIIDVTFSESMDSLSVSDLSHFTVEGEELTITGSTPLGPDFRQVRLHLSTDGSPGKIYSLFVEHGLKNCTGGTNTEMLVSDFAWPEPCESFDLVINEILFNPLGDGVDFVEIYNRSEKSILLSDLILASVRDSPPNPPDTQYAEVSPECGSILPGEYLVLTKNPSMVKSQYIIQDQHAFMEMHSFPYYNNDEGRVLLYCNGKIVDNFHYQEDMHFILLNNTEGVTLERICPDRLGDEPDNWHSAAETAGFGTPGYRNSQYLEKWTSDGKLSINPVSFSPDGDGLEDQLGISYQFSEPGRLISILVFSSCGFLTRTLANNEMPGTTGMYSWDGTMDDRSPAADGLYVIYLEALDMDGRTSVYKKACVLARRK